MHLAEEAQRFSTAEVELVAAHRRVSTLEAEVASLRIHHAKAVHDAKESGEKLLAVLARSHQDKEAALKVRAELDVVR